MHQAGKRKHACCIGPRHERRCDERTDDRADAVHQQQPARDHDVVVGLREVVGVRDRDCVEGEGDGAPQQSRGIGRDERQAAHRRDDHPRDSDADCRRCDQDLAAPEPVREITERPLGQCPANHGCCHEPCGERRLGSDGVREYRRQRPERAVGESRGEATDGRRRGDSKQPPHIDFHRLRNLRGGRGRERDGNCPERYQDRGDREKLQAGRIIEQRHHLASRQHG